MNDNCPTCGSRNKGAYGFKMSNGIHGAGTWPQNCKDEWHKVGASQAEAPLCIKAHNSKLCQKVHTAEAPTPTQDMREQLLDKWGGVMEGLADGAEAPNLELDSDHASMLKRVGAAKPDLATNYIQQLPGGLCFAHGPFKIGYQCPRWPACGTDEQKPEYLALAALAKGLDAWARRLANYFPDSIPWNENHPWEKNEKFDERVKFYRSELAEFAKTIRLAAAPSDEQIEKEAREFAVRHHLDEESAIDLLVAFYKHMAKVGEE